MPHKEQCHGSLLGSRFATLFTNFLEVWNPRKFISRLANRNLGRREPEVKTASARAAAGSSLSRSLAHPPPVPPLFPFSVFVSGAFAPPFAARALPRHPAATRASERCH